jgi:pyruvate formate lyase activating enzyme
MSPSRKELAPSVVVGDFHTRMEDGRVRCDICPRLCTLREGQRGFCFIREARDGEVVLTSYGRSSGFCIDPIEKKPLNHFYPGSAILSFGTAGCNLGCRFCQNWDISKARELDRLQSVASPGAIARGAKEAGADSVAFTYNDPVIFHEYAVDTAKACHDLGLKTVAVTAGYITPKARGSFFEHLDAANVDLKAFTEKFYGKICFAELGPVLETLSWLKRETDVWFEITTLLIPGENDSEDEVARLSDWVLDHLGPDVPLHFTAFHPDFKMTDKPRTPSATLERARAQAKEAGIHHVYTGNVHDAQGQSTWCSGCGALLVERDGYELGKWGMKEGACGSCSLPVPGYYASVAGTWGSRRQPVRI